MIPTTIGRYQIIRPLGSGGMADVYLARDTSLGREVAVKSPKVEGLSAEVMARFDVEARAVARLEHPAIVPLYEYGRTGGRPYLVMRHMRGGSLADRIARGPLALRDALPIIERIATALDHAHAHHIIHRDVKPGNILFDESGQAFLSDFGIARLQGEGTRLTATGMAPATLAYASPEQVLGHSTLSGRSDNYSLGVVLYEMLTGELPYRADSGLQQAMQHVNAPIPDIRARRPDLPPAIQNVINRALAKDPAHRYPTAAALAADLRRLSTGRPPARGAAPFPPWLIAVIVVGALALFAALARGGGSNRPAATATRPASGSAARPTAATSTLVEAATGGRATTAPAAPPAPAASESVRTGRPQIFSPPAPTNDRFEAGSALPPDNILTLAPYSPPLADFYEAEPSVRPWFSSLSPTRLEPEPFQGPDFIINLLAYTCGWPGAGNYAATIELPDGRVEPDAFNEIDRPDECNLYLESIMPPVALGTYTVQFDDFDHMRHSIDVVAPDGPRLYVSHVGNQGSTHLYLHNFRPNEAVRVFEYRQEYDMFRLVGWQAYRVDANGQLYLSTRHCISNICQTAPDWYEPAFIAIGDESGQVTEFNQISTDLPPLQSILASGSSATGANTNASAPASGGEPSTFTLGRTARGTPIEVYRFGNGPQKLLFVGGITGGYAPSTSAVARQAVDYFTREPEKIPDGLTVFIIPLLSPDTVNAPGKFEGRLNANGVDLNRNWACEWVPDPSWSGQIRRGSGGPEPFSEAESRLLRDFILDENPAATVFWYARAQDGLASPGGCGLSVLVSDDLTATFARASGYRSANFGDVPGTVVNGDATNWLDSIGIPSLSVLLPSFTTVDWENNLNGILAVMAKYAGQPVAAAAPRVPLPPASAPAAATCPTAPAARWPLSDTQKGRLSCATNQEHRTSAAFQYYENGTAIWREDIDRVYVLYNNGAFAFFRGDAGPEGYFHSDLLKGAFGYLWNTNETVRSRLGQPITIEMVANDFAAQDFAGGVAFYFYDNGGNSFALFNDNYTWASLR